MNEKFKYYYVITLIIIVGTIFLYVYYEINNNTVSSSINTTEQTEDSLSQTTNPEPEPEQIISSKVATFTVSEVWNGTYMDEDRTPWVAFLIVNNGTARAENVRIRRNHYMTGVVRENYAYLDPGEEIGYKFNSPSGANFAIAIEWVYTDETGQSWYTEVFWAIEADMSVYTSVEKPPAKIDN